MAKRARIIINCCGSYRFFGEPVVKACVEEGTHHVDVSVGPEYMEKSAYIVSGFDSIPADLGVVFLQEKFDGVLNSVVTYLDNWEEGDAVAGPAVNYGTWESAVYGLANAKELGALRKELFPTRLPSFKPKLQPKAHPHKSDYVEGWALPFHGSDRSVVKRSQRLFYERDQKRPIIFGLIFQLLAKFNFGRTLLLKFPEKFSGGFFSPDPPK